MLGLGNERDVRYEGGRQWGRQPLRIERLPVGGLSASRGWAPGDYREHGDDPGWDTVEAGALYGLLEREVTPEGYSRDESGVPTAWLERMRESMGRSTPRFSASRVVREFTEQLDLPAAAACRKGAVDNGAARYLEVDGRHVLEERSTAPHFGEVNVGADTDQHAFEIEVYGNDLDPEAVRVGIRAGRVKGDDPAQQEMKRVRQLAGVLGGCYTGVAAPLEAARILWQR
jgi:starch phosphorylase